MFACLEILGNARLGENMQIVWSVFEEWISCKNDTIWRYMVRMDSENQSHFLAIGRAGMTNAGQLA
jgi:hypothetical protein